MNLTVGDHSARHLRRILRQYLTSWSMTVLADAAELALTELVANVVRHVPSSHCQVLLLARENGIRVEITDGCPKLPTPPRRPTALFDEVAELPESGRGLLIVTSVVDRWGVLPHLWGGKTVWFECDVRGVG